VVGDDLLGRRDLETAAGDADRLRDDVARQREVRGSELALLALRQRGLLLDLASRAAEDVGRVAHRRSEREQIEGRTLRLRVAAQRGLLALDVPQRADLGVERRSRLC